MFFAAMAALVMVSCGNGTPKANMQDDIDSLSYAMGMAQTQGLKEYLVQRLGVDTAYIDEFIKGLNDGSKVGDDAKKAAYYAGVQIGQQISDQMIKGLNYQIFGEDSVSSISKDNFMAGFVAGTLGKGGAMTMDEANDYAQNKMQDVRARQMEKKYGEYKAENEAYLQKIAKEEGVQLLADGIYYKVETQGNGAVPADSNVVKVNYEGKLIDGTVFDSSYKRGEPMTFRVNQVIPGWTKALTNMPVGSKWIIYIPQDQAYGEREAGQIKPFSTLIFTVELLGIEK